MIQRWVDYIRESIDFEKLSHTEEDVYKYTLELLESEIDNIFVNIHEKFNTSSGDITPEQVMGLETIQKSLARLITNQVCSNVELKSVKADRIDVNELSNLSDERNSAKEGDEVIAVYGIRIFKFKILDISNSWGSNINDLGYYDRKSSDELLNKYGRTAFRIKDADLVIKVDTYNDFVSPENRL